MADPKLGDIILACYNPNLPRAAKDEAERYVQQLAASPDGWKAFAQYLFTTSSLEVVFYCLNIIREVIMHRWIGLTESDRMELKKALVTYMQQFVGPQTPQIFRNKLAQVIASLFRADYPEGWPTFFSDIQSALLSVNTSNNDLNAGHVAMFLDILLAIDSEIISTETARSVPERAFVTSIKDAMRLSAVPQIIGTLYNLILKFQQTNPSIVIGTLKSLKPYIHWIDFSLIINDTFLPLLLQLSTQPQYLSGVTDCLTECASKGMDPAAKLAIIQQLQIKTYLANVNTNDVETLQKVAQYINAIGVELIHCAMKLTEPEPAAVVQDLLQHVLVHMFRYLSHDSFLVSKNVITFCHNYLHELKKEKKRSKSGLPPNQVEHIQSLVDILRKKMKYDQQAKFDEFLEDETYFKELRESLDGLFRHATYLCPELVIQYVAQFIAQIDQIPDPFEKEVCIHMFYLIAEGLQDAPININTSDFYVQAIERLTNSNIFAFKEPDILLAAYFDAVKHYARYLKDRPNILVQVLQRWLGDVGVFHPNMKIRLLRCTAFIRFVKSLKASLQPYLMDMVKHLRPLLEIPPPDFTDPSYSVAFDQRLELLEAIGFLVGLGNDVANQTVFLTNLVNPILENINRIMQQGLYKQDTPTNPLYSKWLSQLIAAAGNFSKGFSPAHVNATPIHDYWYQSLLLVINVLANVPDNDEVRGKALFYVHRMIILLGPNRILPILPQIIDLMLSGAKAVSQTNDVIRLLIQIASTAKNQFFAAMETHFLTVMTRIGQHLANAPNITPKSEEERELGELKRSYYALLQALSLNGLINILVTSKNLPLLNQVLQTILEGLNAFSDSTVQKACLNTIKVMVAEWISPENTLPGFLEFVYQQLIHALFRVTLQPQFQFDDLDCQSTLGEIMFIMKELLARRGAELKQYLETAFFPAFGLPGTEMTAFLIHCLQQSPKEDKTFFTEFFARVKR